MEDLVDKLMKNDDDVPMVDEERNQDENALNFDDFSKMMAASTDLPGNNLPTEPAQTIAKSKHQPGESELKLLRSTFFNPVEETVVYEEQRRLVPRNEMDMLENSNPQHTTSSRQSQQSEKKARAAAKKEQQRKPGQKSYDELVTVLGLLDKFDWLEDEIYQSKIVPSISIFLAKSLSLTI